MKKHKTKRGFIALISAIIISAILMAILFTATTSTFFARFDALDTEYKRIAVGLAESCVNQALLRLAQDYDYDPTDEIISIGGDTCRIKSITPHAPRSSESILVTIGAQANHQGAFSNFQVKALVHNPKISPSTFPPPSNIKINSWLEVSVLP